MSRVSRWFLIAFSAAASAAGVHAAPADDLVAQLKTTRLPRKPGQPKSPATWKKLVALGPEAMPTLLANLDETNVVASNWLRTAVDAIGEKALKDGKPLPTEKLEVFVADRKKDAAARRLAYEWLVRVDKTTPGRLLPGMLDDPSAELRRDAVAIVLTAAQSKLDKKDDAGAKITFQKALTGACDEDQVKLIADNLKKLGVTVNLAAHYGFILKWHLVTPFDNADGNGGFQKVYPPEEGVDLKAVYKGKAGEDVHWTPYTSKDAYGKVDLNVIFGKKKGTIAYAYAVIDSQDERAVQLRAGSFNALKMFVNGKPVFERNEYHHGMHLDQHNARITLKKGRNELLLKICQNEQTDSWAQSWIFQARFCDATGVAIPLKEIEGETVMHFSEA